MAIFSRRGFLGVAGGTLFTAVLGKTLAQELTALSSKKNPSKILNDAENAIEEINDKKTRKTVRDRYKKILELVKKDEVYMQRKGWLELDSLEGDILRSLERLREKGEQESVESIISRIREAIKTVREIINTRLVKEQKNERSIGRGKTEGEGGSITE